MDQQKAARLLGACSTDLARHTNQTLTVLYASEGAIKFVFGPLFGPRLSR
jgi:hypothetical protein